MKASDGTKVYIPKKSVKSFSEEVMKRKTKIYKGKESG